MKGIIDFHAHAFPDNLAARAIGILEKGTKIKAHVDGRVSSLLSSMDKSGIEKTVICSIATKISQFDSILTFSKKIRSKRIIPFPSIHPDDPEYREHIRQIKKDGFKGIKIHPYYQEFNLDDEKLFPVYERISEENLILVTHSGFDVAYPMVRRVDPARTLRVKEKFPHLKLVTTHLGGWKDWKAVKKFLVGRKIYMGMSFSLNFLGKEEAREIILNHPREYILFGTDSPWADQGESLSLLRKLKLGKERERLILKENALTLLNSV